MTEMYVILDANDYIKATSSVPFEVGGERGALYSMPAALELRYADCYRYSDGNWTLDESKLEIRIEEEIHCVEMENAMRRADHALQKIQVHMVAMSGIADDIIAVAPLLPEWKPGAYATGDVVQYDLMPYRCAQVHDATDNANWTPVQARSLWANYHATSAEHALKWVAPIGVHDAYQPGEWMIWTDDAAYRCKEQNTVHSPVELPGAWEKG